MTKALLLTAVLLLVKVLAWSGKSVIRIAIKPDGPGSNSCRGKRFFSSPKRPDRFWGPPSLLFNNSFLAVKQPGHEVNHLPPSSVMVKNVWCYNSTSSIYLHGVDKGTLRLFSRVLAENSKHMREALKL